MSWRHLIHPYDYYYFELYRLSPAERLDFIFEHEIPACYDWLSHDCTPESKEFLDDKFLFSKIMNLHQLKTIPVFDLIKDSTQLKEETLFLKKSIFIKPSRANRSLDCFIIQYNPVNDEYLLLKENNFLFNVRSPNIINYLQENLTLYPYITQALVQDNLKFENSLGKTDRLTTIRTISNIKNNQVRLISAILEFAVSSSELYHRIVAVDIHSGKIGNKIIGTNLYPASKEDQEWIISISGQIIPFWDQIINIVIKSHSIIPDIKNIGWDVSVSDSGPLIIEGNIGFSARREQWNRINDLGKLENPLEAILK